MLLFERGRFYSTMKKRFVSLIIVLEVIAVFGAIGVIEQTFLAPAAAGA